MKNLIASLFVCLLWTMGACATEEVATPDASEVEQPLIPMPIGVIPIDSPVTIIRSSATSPILGVPPGSGGAFDPQLCTEYPIGCDPETGACSYFPSGCGQGGGGGGGGGGCFVGGISAQWGCGGGGGGVQCQTGSAANTGQYCERVGSIQTTNGYLIKRWEQVTTCSDGSSDTSVWYTSEYDPATCRPGCWFAHGIEECID